MNVIQWDGQRITSPGIYANIPLADYHRGDICDGPSVSSTSLRMIWNESEQHYWDKSPLNPKRDKSGDDKEAFILGRASHHLICSQPNFKDEFVVRPRRAPDGREWNGNNNSCKEWMRLMKSEGKSILKLEWVDKIRGMAGKIAEHPLAMEILDGLMEHSAFYKDEETGVWLKVRPDVMPLFGGHYGDLKTTQKTVYRDLRRSFEDYAYHQQAALVREVVTKLDLPFEFFTLIWVETGRPHCVRTTTIKEGSILKGEQQNRVSLRRFAKAFDAGHWPAPGEGNDAEYIELSERYAQRVDDRIKYELAEDVQQ